MSKDNAVVFNTGLRARSLEFDLPDAVARSAESVVAGEHGPVSVASMRSAAKNEPAAYARKIEDGFAAGAFSLGTLGCIVALYQALSGIMIRARSFVNGEVREIETDAFQYTLGQAVRAAFTEGYRSVRRVSEALVATPEPGMFVTSAGESLANPGRSTWLSPILPATDGPSQVPEMDPFPEFHLSKEKAHFAGVRNGRTLKLTRDQMEAGIAGGLLYQKAWGLGRWVALLFERTAFDAISDRYGSAASDATRHAYLPNGIPTPLYSATANEPGSRAPAGTRVTNNAFTDASDFENALLRMLTYVDPTGRKAYNHPGDLAVVVPTELFYVACAAISQVFGWLPAGERPRVYASPCLSEISSTAWYLMTAGQNSQFVRYSELEFEWASMMDPGEYLRNLTAFEARIAWKTAVNAIDYTRAVQNLAGTTAP